MVTPLVTKKPCIDLCEFNKRGECKACGRTQAEKKQWKKLPDEHKQAVWNRVLASHGQGNSEPARALQKRYRKAMAKAIQP